MIEPYSSSAGEIIFCDQFNCRDGTFDQLNESVSPCSRIPGGISLNHPYGITVLQLTGICFQASSYPLDIFSPVSHGCLNLSSRSFLRLLLEFNGENDSLAFQKEVQNARRVFSDNGPYLKNPVCKMSRIWHLYSGPFSSNRIAI